jgi:hypothetical protein
MDFNNFYSISKNIFLNQVNNLVNYQYTNNDSRFSLERIDFSSNKFYNNICNFSPISFFKQQQQSSSQFFTLPPLIHSPYPIFQKQQYFEFPPLQVVLSPVPQVITNQPSEPVLPVTPVPPIFSDSGKIIFKLPKFPKPDITKVPEIFRDIFKIESSNSSSSSEGSSKFSGSPCSSNLSSTLSKYEETQSQIELPSFPEFPCEDYEYDGKMCR